MAEVFRRVRGRPLESIIANCEDVQDGLASNARAYGQEAERILAEHRHSGDAKITVETDLSADDYRNVDWFVVLDDTAGLEAAMTIEFGRKGDPDNQDGSGRNAGQMDAIAPLRKAFGLPLEG